MSSGEEKYTVKDVHEERYPHYWTELEALGGFRTSHIQGEWGGAHGDDGNGFVSVSFLSGDVHIGTNYYIGETGIGKHAETELSCGSNVTLSPEKAREVARSIERAADLAEAGD